MLIWLVCIWKEQQTNPKHKSWISANMSQFGYSMVVSSRDRMNESKEKWTRLKTPGSYSEANWDLNVGALTPATITEIKLQEYFQWSCFKWFPGISITTIYTQISEKHGNYTGLYNWYILKFTFDRRQFFFSLLSHPKKGYTVLEMCWDRNNWM